MKKTLCIIMVVVFVLSCLQITAFAEDSGLETAILTVKSRIDIPAEYSEFTSDMRKNAEYTVYNLTWNCESKTDYISVGGISVSITDKGDILNYYSYTDGKYDYTRRLSKFTDEELLNIADEFLNNVNPSWEEEFPENKRGVYHNGSFGSVYVTMPRYVNGIPFCNNRVNIEIDNQTGRVTSMDADYTYADAPDIENVMDIPSAEKVFITNGKMNLSYMDAGENKAILVYKPENQYMIIDATSGEKLEYNGETNLYTMADSAVAGYVTEESAKIELTPEERKNVAELGSLIGEATLVTYAKSIEGLQLDKANFISLSYQKRYNSDEYIAILDYIFIDEDGKETSASVSLNAKTCELLSYYSYVPYDYDENPAPKVSREEAEKAAAEFAKKYAPEFEKCSIDEYNGEYYGTHYVTFTRHENGVPFNNHRISISVEGESGRITSFDKAWNNDYEFESTEGILTAEQAMGKYIKDAPVALSYENLNDNYNMNSKADIKAIYTQISSYNYIISAHSGDLLDYDGKTISEKEKVIPDDIKGHYGEEAISALLNAEIIELNKGEAVFRPDDTIKQSELLNFVFGLSNYGIYPAKADEILMKAVGMELISNDEWSPDELQTRKDGAKYIVRALGSENIAVLTDIFKCGFADDDIIPEVYKGYIALAKGFGVVKGDENGNFNPDNNLTRADAAIMIYNYLNR